MKTRLLFGLLLSSILFQGCTKNCSNDCSNVVKEIYVHKYGVEVCESDWQNRGQNGDVIAKLDNGIVVTKKYVNGMLNGDTTYTYPHSNIIERTETYADNHLIKTVQNDEQGIPEFEVNYSSKGNEVVSSWYNSGNPRSKELYKGKILHSASYFSPSNQEESKIEDGCGIKVCRDSNGELIANEEYNNGIIVNRKEFYPNGSLHSTAHYNKNGTRCEKKKFYSTGEPKATEQWVNGKQNGITIVYKNGEKYAEIPYVNGLKNGIEKRYRDGNTIIEEISWVNDKIQGPTKTYVDGIVSKTVWFYQGNAVEKAEYDFKTSKKNPMREH